MVWSKTNDILPKEMFMWIDLLFHAKKNKQQNFLSAKHGDKIYTLPALEVKTGKLGVQSQPNLQIEFTAKLCYMRTCL